MAWSVLGRGHGTTGPWDHTGALCSFRQGGSLGSSHIGGSLAGTTLGNLILSRGAMGLPKVPRLQNSGSEPGTLCLGTFGSAGRLGLGGREGLLASSWGETRGAAERPAGPRTPHRGDGAVWSERSCCGRGGEQRLGDSGRGCHARQGESVTSPCRVRGVSGRGSCWGVRGRHPGNCFAFPSVCGGDTGSEHQANQALTGDTVLAQCRGLLEAEVCLPQGTCGWVGWESCSCVAGWEPDLCRCSSPA